MKKFFTSLFVLIVFQANAQWSNTTNQFYDSLHTPVSTALKTQQHPIVLKSYPDGGYFIIWEDFRNDPGAYNANGDIYAQKYDKNGNRLWANNGVPVATDAKNNNQHYYNSDNQDYRSRSYAATDSAGGFYVTYADDSVTNYVWERACVQHIRNDGSAVFPGVGYIVATSTNANLHVAAQLIADENKGFFVSFLTETSFIHIFCFRDENNTMKYYGGGIMNENAIQRTDAVVSPCGVFRTYIEYPGTTVIDYNIWGDMQGGCNIVMIINGNTGDQYQMLTYNKLWRAKKNATSTQYDRNTDFTANQIITNYGKDSVYRLWFIKSDQQTTFCTAGSIAYSVTSQRLLQNGYQLIDGSYTTYSGGGYDYHYAKGAVTPTQGNINVSMMAVLKRTYQNNVVSNFVIQGYGLREEKYDSIPYQRASSTNPDIGYNPIAPTIDKINNFRDTLLGLGNYYFDFSLATGANQIYSSALIPEPGASARSVRLQHLSVERQTADSFAFVYKTSTKEGIMIGKEFNSGSFDFPLLTANSTGNALFCIREYNGPARVSPIFNGAELAWGAMGKRVGTGIYNGSSLYYSMEQPFAGLDLLDGTGVIAWKDNSAIPGNTGDNIFMRHLDSLNVVNYLPPINAIKLLPNPYGPTTAYPAILLGSSKKYSVIEALSLNGGIYATTPVAEILDNYNLGNVNVSVFENTGAIRTYNGKPYLNRNYNITPENNPAGGATISVRLYFTQVEFDALKAADPSITSPGDLAVVKQPATGSAPASFIFVAGATTIYPQSWAAVPGGYYIEIAVNSFSNFFIQGPSGALPLTWLNINAQWADNSNAKVSWQVANQINIKKYNLQHSYNGIQFVNVCDVAATISEHYNCTVPAEKNLIHYYRVLQTDVDGKSSLSDIVILNSAVAQPVAIYPNPVMDEMKITGLSNYQEFSIINAEGKLMLKGKLASQSQSISVKDFKSGIYLLKIIGKTEIQTLKFIKQ